MGWTVEFVQRALESIHEEGAVGTKHPTFCHRTLDEAKICTTAPFELQ